jgi:Flp pilus assembly CpaE family ATPase
MIDVILAVPGLRLEPELVTTASGSGIRVLRRCVDAVDLIAAAAIDPAVVIVVSVGLPRLSADVVSRLGSRRRVIGVAVDPLDATALDGLGVRTVVPVDGTAAGTWRAVRDELLGVASAGARDEEAASGVWTTGVWAATVATDPPVTSTVGADGMLLAVWGPMGAPGRTTVAIGIAEAIAATGRRVCLVDADTYAPSVGLALGIADDGGGLVRACRQADNGLLDSTSIIGATRRIRGPWHVLTGVPRAERWSDLSPSALDRVWQSARGAFDVTVVDIGFCIEDDDSPAAWARRRNAAAVTALAQSDRLLAVADGSALGAARLVAAWPALSTSAASAVTIVCNRASRRQPSSWGEALSEFGVHARVHALPADAKSLLACWSRGRSLGEGARRSPLRKSLNALARELVSG